MPRHIFWAPAIKRAHFANSLAACCSTPTFEKFACGFSPLFCALLCLKKELYQPWLCSTPEKVTSSDMVPQIILLRDLWGWQTPWTCFIPNLFLDCRSVVLQLLKAAWAWHAHLWRTKVRTRKHAAKIPTPVSILDLFDIMRPMCPAYTLGTMVELALFTSFVPLGIHKRMINSTYTLTSHSGVYV